MSTALGPSERQERKKTTSPKVPASFITSATYTPAAAFGPVPIGVPTLAGAGPKLEIRGSVGVRELLATNSRDFDVDIDSVKQ
jgi:hypothetical protein